MHSEPTALPEVLLLTPRRFADDRGWFSETWSANAAAGAGVAVPFVQDNHSFSAKAGTLRGLHYQRAPHAQDKLVRCTRGAIFDVAVDARLGSPRYGQWVGVELTPGNGQQLFVPQGFLHGFLTLVDDTEVQYKCSDVYAPACDGGVAWNDPAIGIAWPQVWGAGGPVLSPKDAAAPRLADGPPPFVFDKGVA